MKYIYTDEFVAHIECSTREQSDDEEWYRFRLGRITASIMGNVLNCNMDRLSDDNYIYKKMCTLDTVSFSSAATAYGKSMEKVALDQYSIQYRNDHIQPVGVDPCGLYVSKSCPYVGGSPDGTINCKCCGNGIVEVKCSFTHQHDTPEQVADYGKYHIYMENGKVTLKNTSSWYTQIQTQLFSTQKDWCDFIFFTRKGISAERIYFSETYFDKCISKATKFFKYVVNRYRNNKD